MQTTTRTIISAITAALIGGATTFGLSVSQAQPAAKMQFILTGETKVGNYSMQRYEDDKTVCYTYAYGISCLKK